MNTALGIFVLIGSLVWFVGCVNPKRCPLPFIRLAFAFTGIIVAISGIELLLG